MEQEEFKAAPRHSIEERDSVLTLFFCHLCSLERTFSSNQLYSPALTWGEGGGNTLVDLSYLLSFISWLKRDHFSYFFVLSNFGWQDGHKHSTQPQGIVISK